MTPTRPPPPEAGSRTVTRNWAPEPAQSPAARRETFDALADLFLGDDARGRSAKTTASPGLRLVSDAHPARESSPDSPPVAAPNGPPRVEALVVGHLPVLASAWVMQYARQVAEHLRAPVAVVRLRPASAILELVGPGAAALIESDERPASLADAVDSVRGPVRAWLFRTDQVGEVALVRAQGLDCLTVLAGVDEAATVAAYGSIKSAPNGGATAHVRLVLMGGTPDRAQESSERIARAASGFLGRTVEVTTGVQRISGGRSEHVWAGGTGESIETTLAWLIPQVKSAALPAAKPRRPRATTLTPGAPADTAPPPAPPPIERQISGETRPGMAIAATPAPPSPRQGRLSRHLPGLTGLSVTCPYAPSVELATGVDGVLHLLALDGAGPDPAALPGLTTAAAWVKCHLPLLRPAAAAEGLSLAEVEPVLHLLTTSAPSVRRLADSGIRLHVLASARCNNELVWACADLN